MDMDIRRTVEDMKYPAAGEALKEMHNLEKELQACLDLTGEGMSTQHDQTILTFKQSKYEEHQSHKTYNTTTN
jgi:hypothetical protein